MKKIAHCLSLALLSLLAVSCEQQLPLPAGKPKIVLLGELTAGDSIHFRGCQSVPVTAASAEPRFPHDLRVSVRDDAGGSWELTGTEDDLSMMQYTLSYAAGVMVREGATYTVQAASPSLGQASAQITIPKAFPALVTDTVRMAYLGEPSMRVEISIQDDAAEKQYYVVEVLLDGGGVLGGPSRLVFFSDDPLNATGEASDSTLVGRLMLEDGPFSGQTHRTSVYVPLYQIPGQFPGGEMTTIVQVKSVTEAYFRFLKGYVHRDPFFIPTETSIPNVIKGNIEGGLGILGGAFLRDFRFTF